MVEAHEIHVLIQDALEEALDVLHLQRHAVLTLKVGCDAGDAAALVLGRLRHTTAIRITLTAAADGRAALNHLRPPILSLAPPDVLMVVLVDQQLGAADTDTPENAENLRQELNEEHWAC